MKLRYSQSSVLILLGLLVVTPVSAAPSYLPGVAPGDWAKYGYITTSWQSNIPGLPPPDIILMLQDTESITNTITEVSGSNVTLLQATTFTNGTGKATTLQGSVRYGTGNLTFWLLSGGLSTGDPIFDMPGAPTINSTITQPFAGAVRETVLLNTTFNQPGFHAAASGLWDRPTGVLLQFAFSLFYSIGNSTASGGALVNLVETSLWSTGQATFIIYANPVSLTLTQPATGTLIGFSTITVESVGNSSGEVFIGTGISPNVVNGPTVQVNPEFVTLGPGGLATSTLSILVLPDTVPGVYGVSVTAHSLENRTVFIQLIIQATSQPDFTITAIPNPTPLPAGFANFTAIILTSISGFSGTVNLSAGLAYNNVTGPGFISFQLDPTNLTLPPYGTATSLLDLFAPANSTGTFGVRVTGTSGNLTRETIVDVIIVQQPPPINHPPIAAISYSPFNPTVGMLVSFNGINSFDPDGFITSYQWNFGDNATDSGPFVSHAYFAPGDYFATLTVTDNQGATGTASAIVHVSQQFSHDVAIVDIQLTPATVVAGQSVNLFIILQNQGSQAETVTLTVSANGHIIASGSGILISPQDPYGGFVYLTGNTTGLAPGTYTIAATVFLPTDEDPSDNTLLDGPLTVLPPPTISVTPDSGALATTVTVHGTGFPQPPTGFVSPPILVSFDDMFIGFTLPSHGQFDFVFSIPHSEPGSHLIKALDAFSGIQVSTDFTVLESPDAQPGSLIDVSVTTGPLYFPGETAVIYVLTSINGLPQSQGLQVQATLYKPGGTTQQLSFTSIGTGVYLAEYSVPRSGSLGTYSVVATATHAESSSSAMATFQVKPTWLSSNAPRIASATVAIGGILAAVGVAWRKGYFRKDTENERENRPPAQTPPIFDL